MRRRGRCWARWQGAFGEVETGLQSLGRALALEPGYGEAHLGVGKLRLMQSDLEGSLASLREAVACDAQQAEAWLLLGGVCARLDRYAEAETASREALALLPGSLEARLHLANARLAQGQAVEAAEAALARPVLVVGIARSGTSLVAGSLAACGAWTGETLAGNASNPTGYFENAALREGLLKRQLMQLGADPLGVRQLPPLSGQPAQPKLGAQVLGLLQQQGYGGGPWLYKDAKLTLLWPVWRQAFPQARWVIVRRRAEAIVASCLRTDFMRQHSSDPVFWERWVQAYEQRLEVLKASGVWWREVDAQRLVESGVGELEPLVSELGLQWDAQAVGAMVQPHHWHGRVPPAPAVEMPGGVEQCPPLIVNSVPKSGTHLLGKLVNLLGIKETRVRLNRKLGTLALNTDPTTHCVPVGGVWPSLVPIEFLGDTLMRVQSGQFIQGHLPWSERVAQLVDGLGLRMVLILRDPHAVAVSQVQWMLERDYDPSREYISTLPEDERLKRVITGYSVKPKGPVAVSLRKRYEHMLPWMDHPAVYTTRFEWLAGPEAGGGRKVQFRELRNIATHIGILVADDRLESIAGELFGGTMTFKGGRIDRWKSCFNEENKKLLRSEMGDILEQLGY